MEDPKAVDMCRICFTDEGAFTPLNAYFHIDGQVFTMPQLLKSVFHVELTNIDNSNEKVCSECLYLSSASYKFKQKCENSNKTLHSSNDLENIKIEVCDPEIQDDDFVKVAVQDDFEFELTNDIDYEYNNDSDIEIETNQTFNNEVEMHNCPICLKVFKADELKIHMQEHKALKKYIDIPESDKVEPTAKFYTTRSQSKTMFCRSHDMNHKCPDCGLEAKADEFLDHVDENASKSNGSPTKPQSDDLLLFSHEISLNRKKPKRYMNCPFCYKQVINLTRHLYNKHPSEKEIREIQSLPVGHKNRKKLIEALTKKGISIYKKKLKTPPDNLLACTNCLGVYGSKSLSKHRKKCMPDNENTREHLVLNHDNLKSKIFQRMKLDNVALTLKMDALICSYGSKYLNSRKDNRANRIFITNKMRDLARLLLEIRRIEPEITTLYQALKMKYFEVIIEATKNVAKYDSEKNIFHSPQYAINIGMLLRHCCNIAADLKKEEASNNCENEIKALSELEDYIWSYWRDIITKIAKPIQSFSKFKNGRLTETELTLENTNNNMNHDETTKKKIAHTKRKRRILTPWTQLQKQLVISYFAENIRMKVPPKQRECEELLAKYPLELKNKDWLKIKVCVQNMYTGKLKETSSLKI